MLQRQNIVLPLAQGVDTKSDPKQVQAGKLLGLENGIFTTINSIRKRDGTVALGTGIIGDGVISNGSGLATYGNELLLADGSKILSYDESANAWVNKGSFISTQIDKNSVVRDTYSQTAQDGATATNGLQAYAWADSQSAPSIRYAIIDTATGQTVVSSTLLAANAITPRVLFTGNVFLFYFYSITDTALRVAVLPMTAPLATPVITTLTSTGAGSTAIDTTSPNYDVAVLPDTGDVVLAMNNANISGDGETTIRRYAAATPTVLGFTDIVVAKRCRSVSVIPVIDADNIRTYGCIVVFSWDNNASPYTSRIYWDLIRSDFTEKGLELLAGTFTNPLACMLITGCGYLNGGAEFYYANQITSTAVVTSRVVLNATYDTPTITPRWKRDVVPAGRAFENNGSVYLPTVHQSSLQDTYFLLDANGSVIGKALPQTAGPMPVQNTTSGIVGATYIMPTLPTISSLGDGSYRWAALEQAALAGNGIATATGVTSLTVTFDDPEHSYIYAELGTNLHFTGGIVQMYDGVEIVEHGFNLYPEGVTKTQSNSGGFLGLSDQQSVYSFTVCYEWIDHQNNIHRSRPSPVVEATFASGVTTGSVTLTVPYLQLTDKVGDRPVQLVVYRTTANGTILYRASSLTAPTVNVVGGSSATATISADISISDADLSVRPLLYCQFLSQQPYEVENDPAPPAKLVQLHRNRIWVVDSTQQLQLWYSKECGLNTPVEFNSGFVKQIDPRGGPITALATVDDKLLVFKQSHIFFIVGQGPLSTGQNNDFSDAILITTDVGCIEPRSVVGTPVGIMFQSRKGIYLIDRSLQVQYIGAAVEAYNNDTITSATLVARTNQVRFTLSTGKTLVFDYFVGQWGTFTNQYGYDSLIWQTIPVLLRRDGVVLKEAAGVYTDNGSPIVLKITTSWLTFAGVQGFQRVRRALILGAWKSAHDLQVDVCVDFNDAVIQSSLVQPTAATTYGGATPYGEGLYGGEFQLYQWRIDLARQKCQAVKFTIQDVPAVTAGEGCSLSSIGFEVGAKVGLAKVPASRTAG